MFPDGGIALYDTGGRTRWMHGGYAGIGLDGGQFCRDEMVLECREYLALVVSVLLVAGLLMAYVGGFGPSGGLAYPLGVDGFDPSGGIAGPLGVGGSGAYGAGAGAGALAKMG
ncbi:hypothetical protein L6452_05852 [Arctium lappa]|uniref:Uncharacterized protein n=1 Tax=Arctium lappa TaxID=4217 RepID=A0ACB9EI78_ARCLA|nr:hypothetical protein L6452_05852 [Arctium lappa]